VIGCEEIVVKSLGGRLARVAGLAGATIRGDGQVVLILDIPALV
jgi:chemotaxis protein histidine kinase CheA